MTIQAVREDMHEKIHAGLVFSCCDEKTLADGATANYLITTGALTCHLTWLVEGDTAMRVELFTGSTTSANGTAIDLQNRKIGSTEAVLTTVHHGPTITAVGTKRCGWRSGSATANARAGGSNRSAHEWTIPPNTKAILRVTSISGGAVSLNASAEFVLYER